MARTTVGIDVSKAAFVIAVHPSGEEWTSESTVTAIDTVVMRLQALTPDLIVLEATGGYERALVAACAAVGLPMAVVNPRQVRAFAQALGRTAKTDDIDAHVLADFGARVQPPARPLADAETQALAALVARRRQLVEMIGIERRRLEQAPPTDGSPATCAITFGGWNDASVMSTMTSAPRSRSVRCGACRRTCCAVCRALVPRRRGRCSRSCRNSAV
jgi:hypothetical protein